LLASAYRWVLDPLTCAAPYLLLVGCAHAFWRGPDRSAAVLLAGFSVIYAGALLAVLPENKHFGPLLLPLAVLGALGAGGVVSLARALARARFEATRSAVAAWRRAVTGRDARRVAGIAAACAGALLLVRQHSIAVRRGYLDDIGARMGTSVDVSELIRAPRVFSVAMPPGPRPDPVGYLLTVEAGAGAGVLVCRHLRGIGDEPAHRLYLTRHRLRPVPVQYFFVACLQGAAYDDARTYVCTITVDPDARFVAAARLDLSTWKRPLVSTLFYRGERSPGSPSLGGGGPASEFLVARVRDADRFGLLPEEAGYWVERR
jgi:MFS family permease